MLFSKYLQYYLYINAMDINELEKLGFSTEEANTILESLQEGGILQLVLIGVNQIEKEMIGKKTIEALTTSFIAGVNLRKKDYLHTYRLSEIEYLVQHFILKINEELYPIQHLKDMQAEFRERIFGSM